MCKVIVIAFFKWGLVAFLLSQNFVAHAQAEAKTSYSPRINGTIRTKFEYQPTPRQVRIGVRNARLSATGLVSDWMSYKVEGDLFDQGEMKMLNAHIRLGPIGNTDLKMGFMRVPFTIDAHRTPDLLYFANRSFIAKQVGSIRDVGATIRYNLKTKFPLVIEAGLFSGAGFAFHKDFWTDRINYAAKLQSSLPLGLKLSLSTQKCRPTDTDMYMYDAAFSYSDDRWHAEIECLRKYYQGGAFDPVLAYNIFASYSLPLEQRIRRISFLARYDYMDDHSNGKLNENGQLNVTDYARHRATAGITLGLASKPFVSEIRINYEKYFYRPGAIVKRSEQDKFLIEFMARF